MYSGYAPLSVRIIQHAVKPGWKTIMPSLQLLPGETIEEVQQLPDGVRKRRELIMPYRMNIIKVVNLVTWLRTVKFTELNVSEL